MINKCHLYLVTVLLMTWIFALGVHGKDFHAKGAKGNKNEKLRICIVENRGSFRRTEKYCPILEKQTNIECVIGVDRLDCARRISKGYAHFGVFSSEDLVGARWAGLEILVTSEIRFHSEPFEYDVVVLVDNEANINSASDLRGSRMCHPGKGIGNNWNDIIADYFEKVMVARGCETELSIVESRIKASAQFFGQSCKAGPWINDPIQDKALKSKYPSLCSLCYNPAHCGIGDKHWGRRGPLYCLTSGAGQVAYVRLDDVKSFFGFTGLTPESDPNNFSFLCPDSHLQPLNTRNPCKWISKPWPTIAAKRSHAQTVQELFRNIDNSVNWQSALLQLLESYHVNITSLDVTIPIDDYLDQSEGYQSAHSFPVCNPPRQIIYCTTSIIEFSKCSWLQEVSTVYGIEPNLQCIRGESLYRCLDDVSQNIADLVLVDQDLRLTSQRNHNLSTILHEFSSDFSQNYVTIAVVKSKSNIKTFSDLENKIACFPSYEGAAFLATTDALQKLDLVKDNCTHSVEKFFSRKSCLWNNKQCKTNFKGDEGAFKCLQEIGDVSFMNMETFRKISNGSETEYRVLCPFESKYMFPNSKHLCYLSWTSRGQLLIGQAKSEIRKNEIVNTLKTMDNYFGKHRFRTGNIPFTIFGPFDEKNNILFKDSTDSFKTNHEITSNIKFERHLEDIYETLLENEEFCNSATKSKMSISIVLILLITLSCI